MTTSLGTRKAWSSDSVPPSKASGSSLGRLGDERGVGPQAEPIGLVVGIGDEQAGARSSSMPLDSAHSRQYPADRRAGWMRTDVVAVVAGREPSGRVERLGRSGGIGHHADRVLRVQRPGEVQALDAAADDEDVDAEVASSVGAWQEA